MKSKVIVLFLSVLLAMPAVAATVSEKDFATPKTENLLILCTATPDDPLYHQAINFCYGYLVGAFHYYLASTSGPDATKLVCFPEPAPSRKDAINMFIEWAKAHPQYGNDFAVETEFKFLTEKWPCKP